MDQTEEMLRELHQELMESRNVSIKTDNAVKNLAGEVRQISRRQEAFERKHTTNSVVAYVLFAVLSFAGLFLFFRASVERNALDHALVDEQRDGLEEQIRSLEAELDRRRQAEREAYDFYELLVSGTSEEVVERFATVQGRLIDRATIELFRREVERIKRELALTSFERGERAVDAENWQVARDALTRSIDLVEDPPYSVRLHYYLAQSLYELRDYAGAARYFQLAIESGALSSRESLVAHFRRAESLERIDRYSDALTAYRLFARRFDDHRWASTARARAENLEERIDEE